MEIPGTKRFIPKGFELGTTLSWVRSIVYFPAKRGLKIDTFLTLMGKYYSWVMHSCEDLFSAIDAIKPGGNWPVLVLFASRQK